MAFLTPQDLIFDCVSGSKVYIIIDVLKFVFMWWNDI